MEVKRINKGDDVVENFTRNKILEMSDSLKRLAAIYGRWNFGGIIKTQLSESAYTLEKIMDMRPDDNLYKIYANKIKKKLASKQIQTSDMFFTYNNEKLKIIITAWMKNGCYKSEILSDIIGNIVGKDLVVASECKNLISVAPFEYILKETAEYNCIYSKAMISKNKEDISGDSYTFVRTDDNHLIMAISDGMGTGAVAAADSGSVMDFMEEYVAAGFDITKAPEVINEALTYRHNDCPVTLDISDVDLNTGKVKMIKSGGAVTFIKRKNMVKYYFPSSLPLGVIDDITSYRQEEMLCDGDYLIMISDGVADSLPFYDKEKQLVRIISETKEEKPERMAEHILEECRYYNGISNKDDMTVLVLGIWNRKSLQREI